MLKPAFAHFQIYTTAVCWQNVLKYIVLIKNQVNSA